MNSIQTKRTMFEILSHTYNSFYNDKEEVPTIVIDESNEDEEVPTIVIDESYEVKALHITIDESNEDKALYISIDESNGDVVIDQTFENGYEHVIIDETDLDEDEDEVTHMVIDETDEDEGSLLVNDQTAQNGFAHVTIDETDEDEDEVSRIIVDETDQEMEAATQSASNAGEKRCPELKFIELSNKLQEIVSEIEKLELVPCDLESGITTEFDNCVKLRVKALEVMNKICKLHGSSLKSKPLDFKDFTKYKEFNNKLEKLFKNTSEPPSFKKSLRYLERYNKTFKYGIMDADEMRQIVQDAFGRILVIMRERRGKEFSESNNFFIAKYENNETDPALLDKELEMKLLNNRKHCKTISEAINEFHMKRESLE